MLLYIAFKGSTLKLT